MDTCDLFTITEDDYKKFCIGKYEECLVYPKAERKLAREWWKKFNP